MNKDQKDIEKDGNRNKTYYIIATWNIRGINDKEEELIEVIKQVKIGMNRKKGQGRIGKEGESISRNCNS